MNLFHSYDTDLLRLAIVTMLLLSRPLFIVEAKTVSQDAALQEALDFLNSKCPSRSQHPQVKLVYKAEIEAIESPAYYIFSDVYDTGYVIVGGDDAIPTILGYSHHGIFNADNIAPALQWKLDSYKHEISYIVNSLTETSLVADVSVHEAIEPLLTTQWSQNAPYNDFCPEQDGKRCYTGCVATAIAQIVNYHKWPEVGTGSFSYTWDTQTLSFDYANTPFEWDKMLDTYSAGDSYTEENAESIAKLMLACGIGLSMRYSITGSGSNIPQAKRFLVENLRYDPEMKILHIHNYSASEWSDILYSELENKCPIFCTGGNHAYVCDGYDGNGYFHYNWGWGGSHDGFFLPTLLNPTNDASYHHNETILVGIKKNETGEIFYIPDLICQGEFKINRFGKAEVGPLQNYSSTQFEGYIGMHIINDDTSENIYYEFDNPFAIESSESWVIMGLSANKPLPDKLDIKLGKYKAYPIYRTKDGGWNPIKCFYGKQDHLLLEVDNQGFCKFSNTPKIPTQDIVIGVKNVTVSNSGDSIYANTNIYVHALFFNKTTAPVQHEIEVRFTQNETPVYSNTFSLIIEGCEETQRGITINSNMHSFEAGEYEVEFYDEFGRKLHDERFYFKVLPEATPNLSLLDFKVNGPDEYAFKFTMVVHNNSNVNYNSQYRLVFNDKAGLSYSKKILWMYGRTNEMCKRVDGWEVVLAVGMV